MKGASGASEWAGLIINSWGCLVVVSVDFGALPLPFCSLVLFPAALTPIRACGRSHSSNLINAITFGRAIGGAAQSKPTSLQSLQRRNAVVFLKRGRFGGDLRCVELDLFWVFFGLDFDEAAFNWFFYRLGELI